MQLNWDEKITYLIVNYLKLRKEKELRGVARSKNYVKCQAMCSFLNLINEVKIKREEKSK